MEKHSVADIKLRHTFHSLHCVLENSASYLWLLGGPIWLLGGPIKTFETDRFPESSTRIIL